MKPFRIATLLLRPSRRLALRTGIACGLVAAGLVAGLAPAAGADLVEDLARAAPRLDREVLEMAVDATRCAAERGQTTAEILSIIDYSLPSTEPRLWIFDLEDRELLFRELVAHGVNTGENEAVDFSNRLGSRQSSLGLFLTADTYYGRNGYSLNLQGLEKGFNDNAYARRIVIHGAWYVSDDFVDQHGRLGRSWGCPALEPEQAREVIDRIQGGEPVFVYYPDEDWLSRSSYLNGCSGDDAPAVAAASAR